MENKEETTMERKIGEIFEYNGDWYQCIEGDGCKNCAFYIRACGTDSLKDYCWDRSDGKDVIFKKLEKVEEPYEHCGKLYQCYKLPMEIEIRLLPNNCNPIGKDNLVEIELKQNKEDMEEKNSNLKPFDLEATKSGKPVCTRDGRKARIICFDAKGDKPIIALIEMGVAETPNNYPIDGKAISTKETSCDLMMLPKKKEGWMNVYKHQIYDTLECAEEAHRGTYDYIKTIKVEWEE